MQQEIERDERLDSWKKIAAYLGRNERTAIRWEQDKGLPIRRVPGGKRQAVFAFKSEIDAWLRSDISVEVGVHDDENVVTQLKLPKESSVILSPAAVEGMRYRGGGKAWVIALAAAFMAGLASLFFIWNPEIHKIKIGGGTLILGDGTPKEGLVAGEDRLYFGELRDGRTRLFTIPSDGGRPSEVPTPFLQAEPEDISPDRKLLLVLAWAGERQEERALWILPLDGGSPMPVGNVICHSAAWAPKGRTIAFAQGNAIRITSDAGKTSKLAAFLPGIPQGLRWTLDGRRLEFQLQDSATLHAAFWTLNLNITTPSGAPSLAASNISFDVLARVSNAVNKHDAVFVAPEGQGNGQLMLIQKSRMPWERRIALSEVALGLSQVDGLSADILTHRLYALGSQGGTHELLWFDRSSRAFRPFLPGASAGDVDFSRDGKSIAYVRKPDNSLWTAKADGTLPRQLPTPAYSDMELPRWSPDAQSIAFMAKEAGSPYRIYIVPSNGGNVREASIGTDNQGAPTWSPDGKWLVYGNVHCQESSSCAIHRVNLATGEESVIAGSKGLATARWAPNGRLIAALKTESRRVYVLDLKTQQWRLLAEGINGDDLAWSADSRTLYASRPVGDRPDVVSISLTSGSLKSIVDLSDFSKLTGRVSTWFAVTATGSIIFQRDTHSDGIYRYEYRD
jgi:hypothetical protein